MYVSTHICYDFKNIDNADQMQITDVLIHSNMNKKDKLTIQYSNLFLLSLFKKRDVSICASPQ